MPGRSTEAEHRIFLHCSLYDINFEGRLIGSFGLPAAKAKGIARLAFSMRICRAVA